MNSYQFETGDFEQINDEETILRSREKTLPRRHSSRRKEINVIDDAPEPKQDVEEVEETRQPRSVNDLPVPNVEETMSGEIHMGIELSSGKDNSMHVGYSICGEH